MIEFYPSKLEGAPLERHKTKQVMTIEEWLKSNVPSYRRRESPPISIELNGVFIAPVRWEIVEFGPEDVVRIYPEPKGTGLEIAVWALVAAVVAIGVVLLTQKPLSTPKSLARSGRNLDLAKTTGNQIKLGDVIREAAGRTRIFPDYLVPPRRYFTNETEQWVEMLLCVGMGEYEINPSEIKIGDTSIASLGSTARYQIYGPDESLSSESARLWWHSSTEVGSTSTGSSGLTLSATEALETQAAASLYQFDDFYASTVEGAGWFPKGWVAGLLVRIDAPYPLTFTASADGGATIISGDHLAVLKPSVGMSVELTGANAGEYTVASYTPAVAATPEVPGSSSSLLGSAGPTRFNFDVTPVTFNVGGGPIANLLPDTYSWIASASLPTISLNAGTSVSGISVPAADSGFGIQAKAGSTSTGLWFMLCPSNNAAGWNAPLKAGVHILSFYASSSVDGATLQPGIWDGSGNLGTTLSLSAARTRYSVQITVSSDTTAGIVMYFNRAGLNGNSVTVDSVQIERSTSATDFRRGTRVVTINTAVVDPAGLVSAINGKLAGSGLVASINTSRVKIGEAASPFSGRSLTLTGTTLDVFGATPAFTAGTKTTTASPATLPRMTLAFPGGAPAAGLQTGTLPTGMGYEGLRYRITAVSEDSEEDTTDSDGNITVPGHGPSTITVERLTDTGAIDLGWGGFDSLASNSASFTLDTSTTEGAWSGPFAVCPEGEVVRRVELDFFFPSGLIRYTEKNGNQRQASVKVEAQYRDISTADSWTSVFWTFTATRRDQIGFTRGVTFPAYMRGEMRVRRIGEESTANTKQDRVQWYGLRGRIDKAPTRYDGVTKIALYVKGGSKLSAQSESQVSVIATRKLPILVDGEWTAPVATREIGPWVNHVGKSVGATDDDINIEEFARYGEVWAARGDYFDFSVEDSSTVKECINDALTAGFAEFTLERGQITPVRDEPRTQIGKMYTPQNMTGPLKRSFSLPAPDDYDGVLIKYRDGTTWAEEPVKCKLPGDAFLRVQEITLDGVTDRDRAWRYGMRKRRAQVYQNKSYSWSTELDALNSGYLSYDAVADDIPGYAQSAIMVDYSSGEGPVIIESTEPFEWTDGQSHVLALRRPDGSVSGPWAASRVDKFRIAVPTIDFVPDLSYEIEPPHLLFGTTTRWCYPVLVTSIEPGDYAADVEAVNYDARVYADDNNFAPEDA